MMGQPQINIVFKQQAIASITRSDKGVCLVIVRGAGDTGKMTTTVSNTELPESLSEANKAYVKRAYTGYIKAPRAVLIYEMPTGGKIEDALNAAELYNWDYMALPSDVTSEEAQTAADWIKSQRTNNHRKFKAVLPDLAPDYYGVVDFVADDIDIGAESKLKGADYCARIAGLICGTPMKIACTYAPLPEVVDCKRMTSAEADAAADAGKLILLHDGTKVKLGRGVNSFVTTVEDYGDSFRKIKIVEILDMIQTDLRTACNDSYVGKYANTYDNKCVLLTAISGYLMELENEELVQPGYTVGINLAKQTAYLRGQGIDTSEMSEDEIKRHDTGSHVFIKIQCKPLDAIEDIDIDVEI